MVEFTEEIKKDIYEIGSFNHDTNKEGLAEMYDDIAEKYDRAMIAMGHPDPEQCSSMLIDIHTDRPKESVRILDMGCGTGLTGQALVQKGFKRVHGLDASPGMLKLAVNRGYEKVEQLYLGEPDSFPEELKD